MSRFDLNQPLDFARATMGDVGAVLADFAGGDPTQWDILEGSYNGILFHVFQSKSVYQGALSKIQDTGGRRKVKYKFPYKDGQTTDDLGRKPNSFKMNIMIHGNRYMEGFNALLNEFDKPTPGELVHPIRGSLTAVVEDLEMTHSSEDRKAVVLEVTFIEHNFTIGSFRDFKDPSVKGALAKALETFAAVENAILQVEGVVKFARSVKNKIQNGLREFQLNYAKTLRDLNVAFNGGGSTDLPGLLPVNEGGTRNADGSLTTDTFLTVRTPSDPFQSVPVGSSSSSAALTTSQLTQNVNVLRDEVEAVIEDMKTALDGQGALILYYEILELKRSAVLVQEVLEKGVASSKSQVIDYTLPRLMSIREVAFATGLDVNRVGEIDILNPELESVNYIPKGTVVKVPTT